jgi:hypothetical protein
MVQRRQGFRLHRTRGRQCGRIRPFSAITSKGFRSLQEGQRVKFEVTQGPKGAQASAVEAA